MSAMEHSQDLSASDHGHEESPSPTNSSPGRPAGTPPHVSEQGEPRGQQRPERTPCPTNSGPGEASVTPPDISATEQEAPSERSQQHAEPSPTSSGTGQTDATPPDTAVTEHGGPGARGQPRAERTQSRKKTRAREASVTPPDISATEQEAPSERGQQHAEPSPTSSGAGQTDATPPDTAVTEHGGPSARGQPRAERTQSRKKTRARRVTVTPPGEDRGDPPAEGPESPMDTEPATLTNTVDELLKRPFRSLTFEKRLEVKRLGPHQPNIAIKQASTDRGKQCNRRFNPQWFTKKKWLCASVSKAALFCFPCLLFGDDGPWTRYGVKDMKHLPEKIKKHEASTLHIESCLKLGVFGTVGIAPQLRRTFHISIRKHNELVDKHRHVLSKFIDCIRFCAAHELALRGLDGSESAGVYPELVDFAARIDSAMEEHRKTAPVFNEPSNTILSELLDCMYDVLRRAILQQIKEADFVAVQVDEVADVSIRTQSSLVYRYIHNNTVVERFFGFASMQGCDGETFASHVLGNLQLVFPEPDDKKKLIAQSYDGASVTRGQPAGLLQKVRDLYPNACHMHCYAHQLYLTMQQAASRIPAVRLFFCSLTSIAAYFAESPKRAAVLNEVVRRGFARCPPIRWNLNTRILKIIYVYRQDLLECFVKMTCAAGSFDIATVSEAAAYGELLKEVEFSYFVYLFNEIVPHVDILSNELQRKDIQSLSIRKATDDFTGSIQKISQHVEGIADKLARLPALHTRGQEEMAALNQTGKQVCDIIMAYTQELLESPKALVSASLFAPELFGKYRRTFPSDALEETLRAYTMLDKERLRSELEVLYRDKEFHSCSGSLDIFSFLVRNNLSDCFNETVTLLKILLTSPMVTSESERCFPTLRRIHAFLRRVKEEDGLSVLGMLSIENQLIGDIPDFNARVIQRFSAQAHRRAHFMHKS